MKKNTFILLMLTAILACSASNSTKNKDAVSPFDVSMDVEALDTVTDMGEPQPTKVDESFKVAFLYRGRLGSKFYGRTDLFVMDSKNPQAVNITGDLDWSCQGGCILNPDFNMLGVFIVPDQQNVPTDLNLYLLDKDMKPSAQPVRVIKDVQDAHLAKNVLYFTRKGSCPSDQALKNTYCVYKMDSPLAKSATETELFTFPVSTQDARNSVYSGRFRVTPDGKTLLLLRPTIYSQKVFVWYDGKVLPVGDEVCHAMTTGGACTGSGSEYSDKDPLGISPDRSVVMAALLEDNRDLRLRKINLKTDLSTYSDFYGVNGDFNNNNIKCALRKDWQYTGIDGNLRFTKNGKSVVFIASTDCGDNSQKWWTDIVKIAVDRIGNGKPLTQSDIQRVTDNPQGSSSKATMITDFKFSPSGKYIVFIGTPLFQTDGKTPVSPAGTRHLNDLEVFFIAADGSALPVQATNSPDYMATNIWVK